MGKQGEGKARRGIKTAGALTLLMFLASLAPSVAVAAAPLISDTAVSEVTAATATLEAKVNPQGLSTNVRFEYGAARCSVSTCIKTASQGIGSGSSDILVKATIGELSPSTVYFMRMTASNGTAANGPDHIFATYSAIPQQGLPEGRAYEQATPVNKDGGDAQGKQVIVKAADNGDAVSFGSAFGMPGGVGSQALPSFLATRDGDWHTRGLLPPALFGQRAQVLGWAPDYSLTFSNVTKLGNPRTKALLMQAIDDSAPPVLLTPYVASAEYAYAGLSADRSTVFFEAQVKLPPKEGQPPIAAAVDGASNLYAWDAANGEVHLVSVMNTSGETSEALSKGAFAGPYNWGVGITPVGLSLGGAGRGYYLQETRAITSSGDIYFTAAGTGQLFLRLNPTMPQSEVVAGKCTKPQDACTIHVSATKKTDGGSKDGADPAGPQPAAFQAASEDGSEVFFTSPEMLTDDARTGPEQPEAQIGIGSTGGSVEKADFIPTKAVGLAVDGTHVYWADPVDGTIGRAGLDGTGVDKSFIIPPEGECEIEIEGISGEYETVKEAIPSTPRYLAIDGEYVYWTNTGIPESENKIFHSGSIGRAKLNGTEVDPDFICGASNPQGLAVDATHVYWANASADSPKRRISRANKLDGSEVEYDFASPFGQFRPYGVALGGGRLYLTVNNEPGNFGYVTTAPVATGVQDGLITVGEAGLRGITVDASHVHWASQSEEAIGRAELDLKNPEKEFIPLEGKPAGLAEDAAHLYWSVNGEAPTNTGNDLYRYEPATDTLVDLTPGSPSLGENGAEVQGVVGASSDGSRVYFVANGDLDEGGPASAGDCHTATPHGLVSSTTGHCNLYLLREGVPTPIFIARLNPGGGQNTTDALNWVPTPRELFGSGGYVGRTSFLSADGKTLLFRSSEQLSPYENEGTAEFYRYREGDSAGIRCASCRPGGEKGEGGPGFEAVRFPTASPRIDISAVSSRVLSADGNHVFFESAEALSPADINAQDGCPILSLVPSCMDVYEWTAVGSSECTESSPAYSTLNQGCVFLISTGKSEYPSFFADASASGNDVFFFTRQQLVGQDKDDLQDVYDARVEGGIPSQDQQPIVPCESIEACHGPAQGPVSESAPVTPNFHGTGNEKTSKVPKKNKHKAKKHKKGKHKKQGKKQRRAKAGQGRAKR